ncbi:hypothetical protein D3C77_367160 [compost metagenome]
MGVQAPIEFALKDQVQGARQLTIDGTEHRDVTAPVVPVATIAAADQGHQLACLIDQGDGNSVDLGLNPKVVLVLHPGRDCLLVGQFRQACVGNGVGNRAGGSLQRVVGDRTGRREA